MHARLTLKPQVNAFKSPTQSISSLVGLRGLHITPGASKRPVQRLANDTCLFIVISISWIEGGNEHKASAAEGTRPPLEGLLLFTQRALGSRPCLFIVAGSELILPISF